jgi:hypothetical protein
MPFDVSNPVNTAQQKVEVGRNALWFGLLGGAIAWTFHLLFAYGAAEFGCVGQSGERSYAGISLVAWLELALTVTTAICSAVAAAVAYRIHKRLQQSGQGPETARAERNLAKAGILTSGLFTFIILFESIPVFYYLRDC